MSALEVVLDDGDAVSGVSDMPEPAQELPGPFKRLLVDVAVRCNVTVSDILGPRRFGTVVAARHVAMWVARKWWAHSYPELGRMFARPTFSGEWQEVDHSTVMSAIARVNREIAKRSQIGIIALELHDPSTLAFVPGEGVVLELQEANQ